MGKVEKGVKCVVAGCDRMAVRSISTDKVSSAGLDIGNADRGYLCREHYKELKKRLRKDTLFEKWRRMG